MENNTKPNQHQFEVDSRLAANWQAQAVARAKQDSTIISLGYKFGTVYYATKTRREVRESREEILSLAREALAAEGKVAPWDRQNVEDYLADYDAATADIERLRAEAKPDEDDFAAQQWSRFFLVTNKDGHIHSSMQCKTCHFSTQFAWLPDLSGLTEKDAVDAHGPHLCTVCFPSAPVEWTVGGQKDESAKCPGSGTADHTDFRRTSYTGNGHATCKHCGESVSVSGSTYRMRKHNRKEG